MNEQLSREEVKRKCRVLNNVALSLNIVGFILFVLSFLNWDNCFDLVLSSAACAFAFIGMFIIQKSETLRKEFEKNRLQKIENLK